MPVILYRPRLANTLRNKRGGWNKHTLQKENHWGTGHRDTNQNYQWFADERLRHLSRTICLNHKCPAYTKPPVGYRQICLMKGIFYVDVLFGNKHAIVLEIKQACRFTMQLPARKKKKKWNEGNDGIPLRPFVAGKHGCKAAAIRLV